jgi:hypothetical protein
MGQKTIIITSKQLEVLKKWILSVEKSTEKEKKVLNGKKTIPKGKIVLND